MVEGVSRVRRRAVRHIFQMLGFDFGLGVVVMEEGCEVGVFPFSSSGE